MRTLTALILVAAIANVATAEITMEIVVVDNTSVPELAGYVTQDIVITTDSDWLGAQMIVATDAPGMIYQDPLGGLTSPSPAFFSIAPSLEFDTYVSNGVVGDLVSVTGAVDLGGPPTVVDTDQDLSVAWFTTATDDIGTLALARVTLQKTATGTWAFLATADPAEGPRVQASGPIIPEPATLSLLALGGLAAIRRRR